MRQRIRSVKGLVFVVCLLVAAVGLSAQPPVKRPVPYDAYDSWKSIQGVKISRDGTWLVYALAAQDGDGELVVRNLKTGTEKRQARGRDAVITADDSSWCSPSRPSRRRWTRPRRRRRSPRSSPSPASAS